MISARDKIMTLLGDKTLGDIEISRLVDILGDHLRSQNDKILQLENANRLERKRLQDEIELMRHERGEFRKNPWKFQTMIHYFIGGRAKQGIQVTLQNGIVSVFERTKKVDFPACEVSYDDFMTGFK